MVAADSKREKIYTAVAISKSGAGAHPKHLQTTAESHGRADMAFCGAAKPG